MQELTRESLQHYFNADYNKDIESFINTILKPIFGEDKIIQTAGDLCAEEEDIRVAAAKANIISIHQIAQIRALAFDVKVFDITLSDHCRIQHARKGIQSLVRQFVQHFEGAFLIFHYQDTTNRSWRLSYLEKRSTNNDSTSAKRFTYLCGHNFACRTLAERLLILKDSNFTAADFEKAFSVEALSDDFFKEYKVMYDDIVQYITGQRFLKKGDKWICTPEHVQSSARGYQIYQAFAELYNDDEQKTLKAIRDYVKKLLGRLVFIQFVQKKGWLKIDGIPSYNFLLELFQKVSETSQDNFIDSVLEKVVYMLLNTDHSKCGEIDNVTIDVPFLNGGLFEQDEFDKVQVQLPKEFFHNAKYAEEKRTNNAGQLRKEDTFFLQCGILDLFNQYNFTIDENDPNDAEVGVDPETLGKIFENLLEDNKEKGAFYTPKEIVNYMCQESLIAYLNTEVPGIEPSLRAWVKDCVCDEIINAHKTELQQALENVKICDPAIGSGAFPMGLLNLLVRLQTDEESSSTQRCEVKKRIVQNNIYGVDIEKGAIDIARLRFWLSIVVDLEQPTALPNFDFKFMQGNSLLEQWEGLDLRDLLPKNDKTKGLRLIFSEEQVQHEIILNKQEQYFSESNHTKKAILRDQIKEAVKELILARTAGDSVLARRIEDIDISANTYFFLWHIWFADVFSRPSKQGFDIVIGNPPYLESRSPNFPESLKINLQNEIQKRRMSDAGAFPRGADLLIFFYELSLRLLNKKGYNVFITENSWLSTDYGKLFQNFLLKKCEVHAIIDSEYKYFETADINTIITIIRNKNENNDNLPVKFFHCDGSLEKYPCNTFSVHDTEKVTLKSFLSSDQLLYNYKWGVIIRAEQKLLRVIETISQLEDKSLSSKISIGQGLNLTKSHIVYSQFSRTYPYYTSEIGPTYSWSNSSCYVSKNDISDSRKKPLLIMPRGIGTHFCSINECFGYTSSYVEVYGDLSQEETLNIWLFCNSSLFWLLREITGRTNLGGGMLKAEATDLKSIPMCYNFNRPSEILALYMAVKDKVIDTSISITLNDKQHKMIDAIVLKYFGLDKEESYIVSTLQNMVFRRMKKSKTK